MRRYRFRLQPVLTVRRTEQDSAQGALLAAHTVVTARERALDALTELYAERLTRPAPCTAAGFRAEQAHRQAMAQLVVAQHARLSAARRDQEEAREAYAAAAGRVSALERLDERQHEAHRVAERREEDQATDELVVARYGREDA